MFITQRYENILDWEQATLSTSAQKLVSIMSEAFTQAGAAPASNAVQGVVLTNNDATNTIYLGFDNTATSSKYWKSLAPGEMLDVLIGPGVLRNLWALGGAGTPKLSIAVLG